MKTENWIALALLALGLAVAPAWAQSRAGSGQETMIGGVTQPIRSLYARPNLPQPGVIAEVRVKPGDHVKKGDVVIQQDDRLEQVKLKAAELEAKSTARVDEAKANLDVKKNVLARKEKIHAQNALSAEEVEVARLEVIDAEARLKISELEQAKAAAEAEGQRVKISQMRLIAPFDGVVESVEIGVGEVNDLQKPVCSIVQTAPLWVEIRNMPASWAGKLKVGDKLDARYDERYAGTPIYDQQWMPAVVEFKSPVVNAQSDTQLVRLRMDNARGLEAGLHVQVRLPQGIAPVEPAAATAAP
jgi:RND family efflux transporter MFP subunit